MPLDGETSQLYTLTASRQEVDIVSSHTGECLGLSYAVYRYSHMEAGENEQNP
jgi:hypothetical protein